MPMMQAAILRGLRDIVCDEVPVPEPDSQKALVRMRMASICGTDLHYVYHGWPRNESDLQKLIVPAAAKAIARHAQSQGKHPAAEAAIAERFNADAVDYCSQAATQPPQWL